MSRFKKATGSVYAKVDLKLDRDINPLPKDSSVIVRSRSALGLKYLEIDKGTSGEGYPEGSIVFLSRPLHPQPVEIDEVFNMFDPATRQAARGEPGGVRQRTRRPWARPQRGIRRAPAPWSTRLEPVARNLASPKTGVGRLFRALEDSAAEVAPVAEIQAQMLVSLETTFGAFAEVARPFIQESISEAPPTFDTLIRTAPRIRSFLGHSASLFADLRPGVRALCAGGSANGGGGLRDRRRRPAWRPAARSPSSRGRPRRWGTFAQNPGVKAGIKR